MTIDTCKTSLKTLCVRPKGRPSGSAKYVFDSSVRWQTIITRKNKFTNFISKTKYALRKLEWEGARDLGAAEDSEGWDHIEHLGGLEMQRLRKLETLRLRVTLLFSATMVKESADIRGSTIKTKSKRKSHTRHTVINTKRKHPVHEKSGVRHLYKEILQIRP